MTLERMPVMAETIEEELRLCPGCGRTNAESLNYCPNCGRKLKRKISCSHCKQALDLSAQLVWGYINEILGQEYNEDGHPKPLEGVNSSKPIAVRCLGCNKYYHKECYDEKGCCSICF